MDQSIIPWMGKTIKALDFYISEQFANEGITLTKAQFVLLRVLTRNDGIPQNDLAFITNRDKTSLTRLIHTMERKGFVTRKSSKEDKRINLVFLTKTGKKVIKDANPTLRKINEQVHSELTGEEIESTIETLKKIGENINAEYLTRVNNQFKVK